MKGESNSIDHGPKYPKNSRVSKIRGLDLDPNTFSDNDNYKLQDLSIGYDSGMQHNGYTEDIAKTKNVEKKKQAERKNIHRSFFKTGKEKKTDVMDDNEQLYYSMSYIGNKTRNTSLPMSAINRTKKKKYYSKQKYKYDMKKKKSKQHYYGWLKYMKP